MEAIKRDIRKLSLKELLKLNEYIMDTIKYELIGRGLIQ